MNASKYNPEAHRRRSIRLKNYDYSRSGAYFVTVCTQKKECLFGEIVNGEMQLNNAGTMIGKWWNETAVKFSNIELDASVIMPNHFHAVVVIVGATLCGRPALCGHPVLQGQSPESGQPHRVAPTLGNIVDWFKTMTTNEYIRNVRQHNWPRFDAKVWQRNYYEHIVRNDDELNHIREYIANNPAKWAEDEENPGNVVDSVSRRDDPVGRPALS